MEIHKPKAAHSIREFLIEIGTIICGILIALGLDQLVENRRIAHEVEEARAALHQEISNNLHVATDWMREHPCWIGAVAAASTWAETGKDRPHYPRGIMTNYSSIVWDMTRAGAVTHMPLSEKLALARFYGSVSTDADLISKHRTLATEIGGYLERGQLNATEAADLQRLAGQLRWMSDVEAENAQGILNQGAELKLAPTDSKNPERDTRIEDFCHTFAPDSKGQR